MVLKFQLLTRTILLQQYADILMYGAGGKLEVEGDEEEKKIIIHLNSDFKFHFKWYKFDIMLYEYKL